MADVGTAGTSSSIEIINRAKNAVDTRLNQPVLSAARHLPVLDGIRGVAILLVMITHFAPVPEGYHGWLHTVLSVLPSGWIGVDLFFVLSGFLITGILVDAKGKPHYFRNFYMRRTLRIFPLYYGVLAGIFIGVPLLVHFAGTKYLLGKDAEFHENVGQQAWLWLYGTNIKMVIAGQFCFKDLDHFWSLAIEEHFYLVWPLLVLLLPRKGLKIICCVFILAALSLRIILYKCEAAPVISYVFTPCRIDALAMGGLMALLARESLNLRHIMPLAWGTILSGAGILLWMAWPEKTLDFDHPIVNTLGFSLLALVFGSLVLLSVVSPGRLLLGLFTNGVLRFLGKYSYGLYVFNRLLMFPSKKAFPIEYLSKVLHSEVLGILAHMFLGITFCVAIAFASWHLYEKHFLKLKRFFEYRAASA